MKIALFSAFPQELKHIRKNSLSVSESTAHGFRISLSKHSGSYLIAVETGMSPAGIEAAFTYTVKEYQPHLVLSAGFGGALYYRAAVGDLVLASRYFFLTREGAVEYRQLAHRRSHFQRAFNRGAMLNLLRKKIAVTEGSFITLAAWAAKSELKEAIPDDAPYPVCDRETVHLAKLSHKYNVPFLAIRAITDKLDRDIPEELFHVTDPDGKYSLSRALGLLISKPSLLPDSLVLGRNASLASRNLWEAVKAISEVLSPLAPEEFEIPGEPRNRKDARRMARRFP